MNISIGKQTFHTLFGDPAALPSVSAADSGEISRDYDFTTLDQLMPHPVYGRMLWVCVLNPSDETFQTNIQPLLLEAYEMAVNKRERRIAHS